MRFINFLVSLFTPKIYDPEIEKLFDNIIRYEFKTIR